MRAIADNQTTSTNQSMRTDANREIVHRLTSLSGQMTTIARMYEDGQDPRELVQQLESVLAALNKTSIRLISLELERTWGDPGVKREERIEKTRGLFKALFDLVH